MYPRERWPYAYHGLVTIAGDSDRARTLCHINRDLTFIACRTGSTIITSNIWWNSMVGAVAS